MTRCGIWISTVTNEKDTVKSDLCIDDSFDMFLRVCQSNHPVVTMSIVFIDKVYYDPVACKDLPIDKQAQSYKPSSSAASPNPPSSTLIFPFPFPLPLCPALCLSKPLVASLASLAPCNLKSPVLIIKSS